MWNEFVTDFTPTFQRTIKKCKDRIMYEIGQWFTYNAIY